MLLLCREKSCHSLALLHSIYCLSLSLSLSLARLLAVVEVLVVGSMMVVVQVCSSCIRPSACLGLLCECNKIAPTTTTEIARRETWVVLYKLAEVLSKRAESGILTRIELVRVAHSGHFTPKAHPKLPLATNRRALLPQE